MGKAVFKPSGETSSFHAAFPFEATYINLKLELRHTQFRIDTPLNVKCLANIFSARWINPETGKRSSIHVGDIYNVDKF